MQELPRRERACGSEDQPLPEGARDLPPAGALPGTAVYPTGRQAGQRRPLSVLCVSGDSLFRDRVCRNLEQDGDIFVEISFTPGEALHLMHYLLFDAVVTDPLVSQNGNDTFLSAVRQQGSGIPVLSVVRNAAGLRGTLLQYSPGRILVWDGNGTSPVFARLGSILREMIAPASGTGCRAGPGCRDPAEGNTG